MAVVMMWFPFSCSANARPLMARLSASLPPLVKTIRRAVQLRTWATFPPRAFDGVPAGRTPPMNARRVAALVLEERQHRFQHFRVHVRGRVVVQVDLPRRADSIDRRQHWRRPHSPRGPARRSWPTIAIGPHHLTQQGLVDRKSADRIVVGQIREVVHVALFPGLGPQRAPSPHIGFDGPRHDVVGDLGAVLQPSTECLQEYLVSGGDAARPWHPRCSASPGARAPCAGVRAPHDAGI